MARYRLSQSSRSPVIGISARHPSDQMGTYIEAEFGVRYMPNGLKKQLGFAYRTV